MIRYNASAADLEADINAIDPAWLAKAATRTAKFVANRKYEEASAIWSTVKPAFMKAQKNKCVFCERQFESELYGKIEFDLEHFRPKSSVKAWPGPGINPPAYSFATGGDNPSGYYWLAYDLGNYAASCKVCNSVLKSNYFPVAKARVTEPGDLTAEKAFLCYPIGSGDDDPESLVTYVATTAVPKMKTGPRRRRAQVIIDFFSLNRREQLHRERASFIVLLGASLANITSGNGDAIDDQLVDRLLRPEMPHTACLRAFKAAWDKDLAFGRKVLKACKAFYASGEWSTPPVP